MNKKKLVFIVIPTLFVVAICFSLVIYHSDNLEKERTHRYLLEVYEKKEKLFQEVANFLEQKESDLYIELYDNSEIRMVEGAKYSTVPLQDEDEMMALLADILIESDFIQIKKVNDAIWFVKSVSSGVEQGIVNKLDASNQDVYYEILNPNWSYYEVYMEE